MPFTSQKRRKFMNFLYWLPATAFRRMCDFKAAVELLKEVYGAVSVGDSRRAIGFGGLLYGTEEPIPEEDKVFLGIVDWV